jgi:hypothetical protein
MLSKPNLTMEAASTRETSVNLYQSARRNIPEERHLNYQVYSKIMGVVWVII